MMTSSERNEPLLQQVATIIQKGHTMKLTSMQVAENVFDFLRANGIKGLPDELYDL